MVQSGKNYLTLFLNYMDFPFRFLDFFMYSLILHPDFTFYMINLHRWTENRYSLTGEILPL